MSRYPSILLKLTTVLFAGVSIAACAQDVPGQPSLVAANTHIAAFTQTATTNSLLHIVMGRSIFINTDARISRIFVANPAVLDSYTVDPHQVIITAKTTGVSTLILWDEFGHTQSYQVSSDLDVDDLSAAIHNAFPRDEVQVHGSESRAVLTGNVDTLAASDAVAKLAAIYTKDVSNALVVDPTRIKQVRLKVRIVEIDRAKLEQFGFNFFSQGGTNVSSSTTGQFPSVASVAAPTVVPGSSSLFQALTVSDPLNFLFYSSKYNIGATLKDLENKNILQILAEPNITTLSGQKADFLAGGEFPYPVIQGGVGAATSVTIQFRAYGVRLDFLPIVNADGTIELTVAPEVSALDYSNAVSISGYTIPAVSTRRAETQVNLRSGESFAIGGLLDERTTDLYGRTPGFSNVPVLGQLFKSKSVNHTHTDLVVIVTPEIIDPVHDNIAPVEPALPVPMLAPTPFDQSLPKGALGPATASPAVPVAASTAAPAATSTLAPVTASPAVEALTPSMVQVATLTNQADADALLAALKNKGYAVSVETEGNLIHILIGPFSNRKDADVMCQRLIGDGYSAVVIDTIGAAATKKS